MRRRRTILWAGAGIGVGIAIAYMSASGKTGLTNGRLNPCPDSPNCVCSQDSGHDAYIEPLAFAGPADAAMERLKQAVLAMPRTRLISEKPGYLHFEFRTAVFRFVDDVEFVADSGTAVIHVRSASRLGYSDLGTNRRRVETIREAFNR